MKRVVFRFIEDIDLTHINIQGDCIDVRDGFIVVWNGDLIVAMVKQEIVKLVYISEKKDDAK